MSTIKGFTDTIAWYDANAQQYAANIQSFPNDALLAKFSELVGDSGHVLDAGCAAGRDTKLLHDRGLHVVGIDLSQSLLEIAREKYPEIEFVAGNFLNLPFADASFAGVWAHASLLHLETVTEVEVALGEFNRVLKANGVLHVFVKQQLGAEKTSVVSDAFSNHDRFFQWFTLAEIQELLQKAGFTILEIQDNLPDPGGRAEVKWINAFARKGGLRDVK